jgi:3-carboxy-cis,cis-muconate cycloisomerase
LFTHHLIHSLSTTEPLAEVFSDASLLGAMLEFEVALSDVQARLGLIPPRAADAIRRAAVPGDFDVAAIARQARVSATIALPFVAALTARVRAVDAESAGFVHWGATSQDVSDTALLLSVSRARQIVLADHSRLLRALLALSDTHANTVMLGRTLLQPAPPITFGLKVAGWAGSIGRAGAALTDAFERARVLQFGGATGTLAALGDQADAVESALAEALGLARPDAPWHAHRDRLGALISALGVYTGTLGKMAADIALLMQHEVDEVREPGGGSSTMPHKRNPSGCAGMLAAAARVPGLVSTFLSAMPQAHERGVGGLQAEAPTLTAAIELGGTAAATAADVILGLEVRPARMRANIEATDGVILAERVAALVSPAVGRDTAHRLVTSAVVACQMTRRPFAQVVASTAEIAQHLTAEQLASLNRPEDYLGAAETFRRRLVTAARASLV